VTLTVISVIILAVYGSSESFFGSLFSLIILTAVFLALATEFGFITP
jgi:hypothetical protein